MSAHSGWWITDANRPVTGKWRAVRQGVSLCGATEDAVKRMIDARNAEERRERKPAAGW